MRTWVRLLSFVVSLAALAAPAQAAAATDSGPALYRVGNRTLGWHQGASVRDSFLDQVQPIFTSRCVACHACYEAPCQLNLQSYEGIVRGYHPAPIYDGKRLQTIARTRYTDTLSAAEWQRLGFNSILAESGTAQEHSLLQKFIQQAVQHNHPGFPVEELAPLQQTVLEYKPQCVATNDQLHKLTGAGNPWNVQSFESFSGKSRYVGMPWGLPPLSHGEKSQTQTVTDWMHSGSPGPGRALPAQKTDRTPSAAVLLEHPHNPAEISAWETFLNTPSSRGRHTARYLYEHLFSALISFKEMPGEFYEIIRSRTAAPLPPEGIHTELPYESPGISPFFYRLRKVTRALPQKTQNVWEVDHSQIAHLEALFLQHPGWKNTRVPEPVYGSTNPFEYFAPLPAQARSQFLRENSRLIVGAMVQGTVCIGSRATYAIADHFWVWFLKPESDPSVALPDLGLSSFSSLGTAPQPFSPRTKLGEELVAALDKWHAADRGIAQELLRKIRLLEGISGALRTSDEEDNLLLDVLQELRSAGLKAKEIIGAILHLVRTIEDNRTYQAAFEESLRTLLAERGRTGLGVEDLWNTHGTDRNAWLSITRHELSATVQQGPAGGVPQNIWVLSYANFERLYYNLVASFRAWGSVTHKLATWRHMSYVRLEGEDLAISFLPAKYREQVRERFTAGLGALKNNSFFPLHANASIRRGFGGRASAARNHQAPQLDAAKDADEAVALLLKEIRAAFEPRFTPPGSAVPVALAKLMPSGALSLGSDFAAFMPNTVHLRVTGDGPTDVRYFSLIADRAYKGHNLVLFEKLNRDARRDTLSVYAGFVGAYPNLFLSVDAGELAKLAADISALRSEKDWVSLRSKYGVSRTRPEFWEFFDSAHHWKSVFRPENNPNAQGILDLSQYELF